jgi:hypothetical protein
MRGCLASPRRVAPPPPTRAGSPSSWLIVRSAKPSAHTAKAYRQDFEAVAALVAGAHEAVQGLRITDLNKDTLRAAFAANAETHSAASIRRCLVDMEHPVHLPIHS